VGQEHLVHNFTPDEIANAMTKVSGNRYTFEAAEIVECESRSGEEGDPLSRLYEEKLDYGLKKPRLLEALADLILSNVTEPSAFQSDAKDGEAV
jgi:hypothetical protein